MKFLYKLERKIGKYAIKHLMFYIIGLYIVGWLIQMMDEMKFGQYGQYVGLYARYLAFDAEKILSGQVWRIITFIIMPPENSSYIFMIFTLYLYYILGTALENAWGAFRFNLYFFMGILMQVIAGFLGYFVFDFNLSLTTYYLNMSLFFAFATIYPDMELFLFFLIPIKIKWLALIDGGYFIFVIISNFMIGGTNIAVAVSAMVSLLNFVIFFLMTRNYKRISPVEIGRKKKYKRAVKIQSRPNNRLHTCAVCGRTSETNPELSFRYCSKCNGNFEYCQDHLFTHEHKK